MTLADLVCSLRQRLVASIERNDRDDLQMLCTTFGVLREVSYPSENKPLIVVFADLEYSAQHAAMGVMAKARDIPSIEEIQTACSILE
jgi:hypothetical protein